DPLPAHIVPRLRLVLLLALPGHAPWMFVFLLNSLQRRPRPANRTRRIFRLFNREEIDKRRGHYWRRGCNEWLPKKLASDEAEISNAHITTPLRKPRTVLIRPIGLSLNEPIAAHSKTTWQDIVVDDGTYSDDGIVGLDGLTDSERHRRELVETAES